jgi:hypothetical protein
MIRCKECFGLGGRGEEGWRASYP